VTEINRRLFLKKSTACAITGTIFNGFIIKNSNAMYKTLQSTEFKGNLKKSLYYGMLPKSLGIEEKFKVAKKVGFEGIEVPTIENPDMVEEMKQVAKISGIKIHSIMNSLHWKYPFSSDDPSVIKKGMEGMETSLRNAKEFGADTVLLVPAVVDVKTSYKDAYTRSQKYIKELLTLAKELNVIIAIENVWNKFLLSPLEFLRYIEEFDNPYLKAYFDVGNIVLYGIPQDWIRTLGKQIVKIHIKGFNEKTREFVNLGEGTIDWLEVRRALSDIGYNGYITAELRGGDENYLLNVSGTMDKIIAGEKI
jgi:hexulose-6-phosphate isomerase